VLGGTKVYYSTKNRFVVYWKKEPVMVSTVMVIAVVLGTAFLFNELFKKLKLPPVVGQIIGGLILGIPILKSIIFQSSVDSEIVSLLATLGILFLLLLVGLEIDVEKIRQSSKESVLISLSAALVPLIMGFLFLRILGYGLFASLVFGGALSVTAEGTTVKVLLDANALNTKLGAVIVSAGAIDDIFEVLFLSMVTIVGFGGSVLQLAFLPLEFLVFVVVAFLLFRVISKVLQKIERRGDDVELFSLVIIFVLVISSLSEFLQMGYLLGAIISGFLLQISLKRLHKKDEEEIVTATQLIILAFVVPFFFVNIGLNFNYYYLVGNLPLLIFTITIAFLGKIIGTMITKPFVKLSLRQLYLIGW
jgi:Kef-type K+ transport system membrane component KefB